MYFNFKFDFCQKKIFFHIFSCDRETTFCLYSTSDGTSPRGGYTCVCKDSYFIPNQTILGFDSSKVEEGNGNFSCIPCPGGCPMCDSTGMCSLPESQESFQSLEALIKASISAFLGACILCCFALATIVFRQRKCKAIATGMWTILETILLGIILLYSAVSFTEIFL